MHPSDFGWSVYAEEGGHNYVVIEGKEYHVGDFLTEILGVTYAVAEDNKRKSNRTKYDSMKDRHKKLFKKFPFKQLMKYKWGRNLLFFFFGKKKDKKKDWPEWVKKTDEERVQNMPFLFPDNKDTWMVTEKIDGTSTTFTMLNDKKKELIVCSRNVVFNAPEKEDRNYYKDSDGNVYLEMASKYRMKDLLSTILDNNKDIEFVTIQGETYGKNVQNRDYGLDGHDFMAFNLILGYKNKEVIRMNSIQMRDYLHWYDIPCVPILDEEFTLPATCQELLDYAASDVSRIDGGMREGIVLRTLDGKQSFKAVSNEFLLKYHS